MEMKSLTLNGTTYDSFNDKEAVRFIESQTFRVGENLLSDSIATLGAGWSGNMANGFTHSKNNTEPLTFAINAADGEKYLISARFSKEVSAIHLTIGDSYPTDPYGTNPFVWGVQAVNGGSLKVTPFDKNWAGTLYELECRKITDDGTYEVLVPLDDLAHNEMPNHIAGFWNIQMGKNALKDSINATRCLAIGYHSLGSLKTGGRNIGLGTYTFPYMEYGEHNIGIGADSGMYVQEAYDCISIGKGAMQRGKCLKNNVAIGNYALNGVDGSESVDNVAIGHNAGFKSNTAKNNVFIGQNAGYNNTTGVNNILIGSDTGATNAGTDNNATGNMNVAIGANAKYTSGQSCSTAIGYQATTTKSNQVVIGKHNGGWGDTTETMVCGNFVVYGTDGVKRQIVFNADGTCSWTAVE